MTSKGSFERGGGGGVSISKLNSDLLIDLIHISLDSLDMNVYT